MPTEGSSPIIGINRRRTKTELMISLITLGAIAQIHRTHKGRQVPDGNPLIPSVQFRDPSSAFATGGPTFCAFNRDDDCAAFTQRSPHDPRIRNGKWYCDLCFGHGLSVFALILSLLIPPYLALIMATPIEHPACFSFHRVCWEQECAQIILNNTGVQVQRPFSAAVRPIAA